MVATINEPLDVAPLLIITREQLDEGLQVLDMAVSEVMDGEVG